jgi:hypothetical protein
VHPENRGPSWFSCDQLDEIHDPAIPATHPHDEEEGIVRQVELQSLFTVLVQGVVQRFADAQAEGVAVQLDYRELIADQRRMRQRRLARDGVDGRMVILVAEGLFEQVVEVDGQEQPQTENGRQEGQEPMRHPGSAVSDQALKQSVDIIRVGMGEVGDQTLPVALEAPQRRGLGTLLLEHGLRVKPGGESLIDPRIETAQILNDLDLDMIVHESSEVPCGLGRSTLQILVDPPPEIRVELIGVGPSEVSHIKAGIVPVLFADGPAQVVSGSPRAEHPFRDVALHLG